MSLRTFFRAVFAYLFASAVCGALALAAAELFAGYGLTWWPAFLATWCLSVGIPSVGWASSNLSRTLGVRPGVVLQVGGWRHVPIAGALGDLARSVVPVPAARPASLAVGESVSFRVGPYLFTESDLLSFLRPCWVRQRRGDHPFSRRYWLDRGPFYGDRAKYDAMSSALLASGLAAGRGDRSSGRLLAPPLACVSYLRHMAGQTGLSGL